MKKQPAKSRYSVPALEKGLDILELFASEPLGLTKSDVARRLGRTISEIFRMLMCLEERGYISQIAGEERYRLTLRIFELAQEYPPRKRLASEAFPIMQRVANAIHQSCHLGVLEGGKVVIIAQVDSPVSPGFSVRPGASVDLMRAATGYVILAHQTPEVRERAVDIWRNENRAKAPARLASHLAAIKKHGFEQRKSYESYGVINVSFPILDDRGNALAALTVPYLKRLGDRTTLAQIRTVLEHASRDLTVSIGGSRTKPTVAAKTKLRRSKLAGA